MSLSYFAQSSVTDGTYVNSSLDLSTIVSTIQGDDSDPYFDATSKIGKAYVYYTHTENRQQKKIVHDAVSHVGSVKWSSGAKDGTWEKTKLKVFDTDGAVHFLYRALIGTGEDITHSDGTTTLNLS